MQLGRLAGAWILSRCPALGGATHSAGTRRELRLELH
jgi:hypothetical protein